LRKRAQFTTANVLEYDFRDIKLPRDEAMNVAFTIVMDLDIEADLRLRQYEY
jgi:hypothetical protein